MEVTLTMPWRALWIKWGGIFIILGLVSVYAAYFFYYGELIPLSIQLGVRVLTVWDRMKFVTWALDGILWIISGGVFLIF